MITHDGYLTMKHFHKRKSSAWKIRDKILTIFLNLMGFMNRCAYSDDISPC